MKTIAQRIGDRLSEIIDRIDSFVDGEVEFLRGLIPYKGQHRKKWRQPDEDSDRCHGCMGAAFGDCEDCERWRGEK